MPVRHRFLRAPAAAIAIAVVASTTLTACSGDGDSADSEPAAPTYDSLARAVDPIGAEGRALGLSRVVIQPGAKIPLHYHEGTQLGYIESGTLTYTVHTGEVRVMTGPGDDGQVVREITAGQTGDVDAGQWIVEQPSEEHRAANLGDEKIVIYLANLLRKNADPSTPVK